MRYRQATHADVQAMAAMRSTNPETAAQWAGRIAGYMKAEHHPQKALLPRALFVAETDGTVVGFIAGHLTLRFACEGELQWIDVVPAYQRKGVASALLRLLAAWFIEQKAYRICVNSGDDNRTAHAFYKANAAVHLTRHWLVWNDAGIITAK